MATEANNANNDGVWTNQDGSRLVYGDIGTSFHLIIDCPTTAAEQFDRDNIISQDDDDPSAGMSTRRMTRQQRLLHILDVVDTPHLASTTSYCKYPLQFLIEYANAVFDGDTCYLLEYRHLVKRPKYKQDWEYSFGNKIGRLCQGMPGRTNGTSTMHFIAKS